MTRRGLLGLGIVSGLAFLVSGCGGPGHCVYYVGGNASLACSEFEPGETLVRLTAHSGETVLQVRDRALAALAEYGVDVERLPGKLGWGTLNEALSEGVMIGAGDEEPMQVTDEDDPVYPENYEFMGGETVAFFFLAVTAIVQAEDGEQVVDATDRTEAQGRVVLLRAGRVVEGATLESVAEIGDEVVIYT